MHVNGAIAMNSLVETAGNTEIQGNIIGACKIIWFLYNGSMMHDETMTIELSPDITDITDLLDWSSYCAIDWSMTLDKPVTVTISEADASARADGSSETTLVSHTSS